MTQIFISYKREDEPRAGVLVKALEAEGLQLWWDRGLPGGEEWRANIERALNEAKVVIVLWTRESVGPNGGFVRDEASRAGAKLVPVRIEPVMPPLGFGEVQAIDLAHWRGNRADPFFKDLVAVVRAKLAGQAAPPSKGPAVRLYRRLRAAAIATLTVGGIGGFALNALGVQDYACAIPSANVVSDVCGAVGLGHRPRHDDRVAWESRTPGDCAVLRSFASNEASYYHGVAADMYGARTTERAASFSPAPRELTNMYLRTAERPSATEAAARADALRRTQSDAELNCAARDENERLAGADVHPPAATAYDCRSDPRGGYNCALTYSATCRIEARALVERCQ